ncbi:MAG: M50 family metallopeptidase [Elusimicrobia bacterium]|nr:M50 family metallopeptidase [Elusimicrobiota bacterium]
MPLRPDSGPDPARVAEVARLLENTGPEPIQPSNHTSTLLISALLFLALGTRGGTLLEAGLLLGAIFVHELGHFAAMRLFGYRNTRILFLPLLGGVTSGVEREPDAFQRAVVSLAGPAPSIVLGAALLAAAFPLHSVLALRAALTILWLNLLNLLPIAGLDGGNFVQRALGPSPGVALAFRLVTGAAGLAYAAYARAPILGLWFGFMTLSAWTVEYRRDVLGARLRREGPLPETPAPPPERIGWLVHEIERRRADPKLPPIEATAVEVAAVWLRARERPVGGRRLAALAAVYAASWALGLFCVLGLRLLR